MKKIDWAKLSILLLVGMLLGCTSTLEVKTDLSNAYPWVIVEFDSLNRTPTERIAMLNEIGFSKYAYDWNFENLDSAAREFELAKQNDIEITAVWFWLNAKRDSIGHLHESNERMLKIVEEAGLMTTFWVSFNDNFFEDQNHTESVEEAAAIIRMIYKKASTINCNVALYNHRGWFGNPSNQREVIKALSDLDLGIVYNFHHAHHYLDDFPEIVRSIKPYLTAVNLNGMRSEGPEIIPLGQGNLEAGMIKILKDEGFSGPWGILGHVRSEDVEVVLQRNIKGYRHLILDSE